MRRIKKQTAHGLDQYAFLEASEIPAVMKQYPQARQGSSWIGDSSEALVRKATVGDNGLVEESEKFLSSIEDQVPMSRGWKNVDDVVGAVPNITAYLAGHPQHMRRRQRASKENAPLTIYMDLTSSAAIDAKDVQRRGTVLLALVRMLCEHRPVELWVGVSKGRRERSGTIAWRIDTAPLDLARSSYHIGAAAMARGFGYGMDNAIHDTGPNWPFADYATHVRTAEARLRSVIDWGDVLYIPPVINSDPLMKDPVAWLKRTMQTYVKGDEE